MSGTFFQRVAGRLSIVLALIPAATVVLISAPRPLSAATVTATVDCGSGGSPNYTTAGFTIPSRSIIPGKGNNGFVNTHWVSITTSDTLSITYRNCTSSFSSAYAGQESGVFTEDCGTFSPAPTTGNVTGLTITLTYTPLATPTNGRDRDYCDGPSGSGRGDHIQYLADLSPQLTILVTDPVQDVTAPTLSSSTPADNATGVSLTSNIVLGFSENVTAVASKNIVIKKSSDNTVFETISATDGSKVTVSGSTVTVNPAGTFDYSTGYYVTIDAGAFKDAANNNHAGISSSTALNFTTLADVTAPTLSSSSPADDATGVSVTPTLTLNFSENVTAVSGKNIVIKRTSNSATVETVPVTDGTRVSVSGSTVTVTPSATLAYLTAYHVTIDAGAFEDAAGNAYAGISSSTALNFTTSSDSTPPALSSSVPADNATGVAIGTDIVLTFSEAVTAVAGKNVVVKRSSNNSVVETVAATSTVVSGTSVTVALSAALSYSTAYHVTIDAGAFEDAAGNAYAGISSSTALNFTTGPDQVAPVLASSVPADNATGVALSAGLALTFSEAVTAVSGRTIKVVRTSGSTVVASFAVTDGTKVTVSGTAVTVASVPGLENSTGYHVTIDAGAFEDAAGNAYAGISSSTALNFTTVAAGATTTTVAASPAATTASPAGANSVTTTTVKSATSAVAPATTAAPGTATTVAATTTTVRTATTTTLPPAPDAPEVSAGQAAALVNGESVTMTYTRENNAVTAAGAGVSMKVSVVGPDGGIVPLGADGSLELGPDRSVAVSLTGLRPGSGIEVWLFSTPVRLGESVADDRGMVEASFRVPAGLEPGDHRLVAEATNSGNASVTVALALVVPDGDGGGVAVSTIIVVVLVLAALAALVIPASRRRRRERTV